MKLYGKAKLRSCRSGVYLYNHLSEISYWLWWRQLRATLLLCSCRQDKSARRLVSLMRSADCRYIDICANVSYSEEQHRNATIGLRSFRSFYKKQKSNETASRNKPTGQYTSSLAFSSNKVRDIRLWGEMSECTLTLTGELNLSFCKVVNAHVQLFNVWVFIT